MLQLQMQYNINVNINIAERSQPLVMGIRDVGAADLWAWMLGARNS
jgi:hypothetical protein